MTSSSINQVFFLFALVAIGAIIEVDAKPPSRIFGNAPDAEDGVYTWLVSIGVGRPIHICGGAIISNRHILTAAHCIYGADPSRFTVRGGITHIYDRNAIVANVVNTIAHPNYRPGIPRVRDSENDIAILVLDKDLDLGERLTKVSLPKSQPKKNQQGLLAGWGAVSEKPVQILPLTLKNTVVTLVDDEKCSKYGKYGGPVGPQSICGSLRNGSILNGDSGSPLVSDGQVIGIAASGSGIAGIPDVFTNVYHYRSWINSIVDPSSNF